MPRKIRQLRQDLRKAGFRILPERGKGSHQVWAHPELAGLTVTIPGHDGDDARFYLEDQVRAALVQLEAKRTR